MASDASAFTFPPPSKISPEEKRLRHADAQCRYRERNLEQTRQKARKRMELCVFAKQIHSHTTADYLLCYKDCVSDAPRRMPGSQRSVDASWTQTTVNGASQICMDYKYVTGGLPRCRKRKFIEKYGRRAYTTHYLPLHDIYGPYITNHMWVTPEQESRARKRQADEESRAQRRKARATKDGEAFA
ncbi:hypothetical protein C8R43DRAFT_1117015 [Mycena crocata]|nr:hypothetical protein C8R43DRAFT_1117015 [Mycena crocata]